MTQLKSLLYLSLLLCVFGLYNGAKAQNQYYVNEDFERYGWWLGGPGNWTTGILQAPFVPPSTNTGHTWGPGRTRFYRVDVNDNRLFSAYGSRPNGTVYQPTNYDSFYQAGIHSFMNTTFKYSPTANRVYLNFMYFVNFHWTLVNGSDEFYVAVKKTSNPDVPASWTTLFKYVRPQAGDNISGSEKWFSAGGTNPKGIRVDSIFNALFTTNNTDVDLRFAFISRNTPPNTTPPTALRAWGVWIDNVVLYQDIQYDLYAEAFKLVNIIDLEVTSPTACESFKPMVKAGSTVDGVRKDDTFKYRFFRWNYSTNSWEALTPIRDKQQFANQSDWWNPLDQETNKLVSFGENGEARFKLELYPYISGTAEKDINNNTVTRIYVVPFIKYEGIKVDAAFNNAMYPEPATSVLLKTVPQIKAPALWMEKNYDLTSTQGKTQVQFLITKNLGFNLPMTLSAEIVEAYNIINKTNNLVAITGDKLQFLKDNISFSINADGYLNAYPQDVIPTNIPYVIKFKITAYYKSRYNGNPVCVSDTNYLYAIIPRDYILVPEKDREIFKPSATLDRITHKLNVWRFNKHNRKVKFEFYGNFYFPAGTLVLPDYSVNRNNYENVPPPVDAPRPRISQSVDEIIFGKVVNGNAPAGVNDYFPVNMKGFDGNILADTVYYYKIMADVEPDFSLVIVPQTATIQKPGNYVYTININRVNHTGQVTFNAADVTSNPSNGNLVYTFSSSPTGPWAATGGTTGNVFYMKVDAGANTPSNSYEITVTGKSTTPKVLSKTAKCTLIVSANWRAKFTVREWNTFNPTKDFYFGMHTNAGLNLDPANIWPDNNEALVTNVPAPPTFSWYFKFLNGSGYTANEYRPLTEDPNVTTTYFVELRGRYPFIIYYDPRQTDLQNKEIKIMDVNDNGGSYLATIAYNANKTADTLPMIYNWALADVWQLKITVKYKPSLGGSATDVTEDIQKPADFKLLQNYPNPFNPSTVISYSLPKDEYVKLVVVNSVGEVVSTLVDGLQTAGTKSVVFNAKDLPSGIYFYKIQAGSFVETKKMMLVK